MLRSAASRGSREALRGIVFDAPSYALFEGNLNEISRIGRIWQFQIQSRSSSSFLKTETIVRPRKLPNLSDGPILKAGIPTRFNYLPRRQASNIGNQVQHAAKTIIQLPATASRKAFNLLPTSARRLWDSLQQPSNLQRAVSLQLEAAWQQHKRKVLGAGLLVLAYTVWRAMRKTASAFIDVSQSLAATGLISLGAALSIVAVAWLYRRHFVISPTAVYRSAMLKLDTHPGALEVLGAPLVGSDVRATVTIGGGLKFKGLRPKLRSRRVSMIFPLKGSERQGLVSVEAKKKAGHLKMTLLAVDVPMPAALGGEQRLFIEGGPKAYSRGGVLDELRRPFLAALTSEDAAEEEDEAEEQREAAAEMKSLELKKELTGKSNDNVNAMQLYNRAASAARDFINKVQQIRT